jgi:hypothetical protein
MSESQPDGSDEPALEFVGSKPDCRFYFVSYWVREEGWIPREALIALHPLEWLSIEKSETMNHVHLAAWQEIDRETYLRYHPLLTTVDDQFSEPTQATAPRPALPPPPRR